MRHRPLRVSPEMEAEVSRQIDEMLGNGIIRPSTSPWASRVILVKKKDGSHRFAVDCRDLNNMSKLDAYPMPDARDVFDRMGGSTIFSKLNGVFRCEKNIKSSLRSFRHEDSLNLKECRLVYQIHRQRIKER